MSLFGKKEPEPRKPFDVNDHAARYYKKNGKEKRNLTRNSPGGSTGELVDCPRDRRGDHNTNLFTGKIIGGLGTLLPVSRGARGHYGTCADCQTSWQID